MLFSVEEMYCGVVSVRKIFHYIKYKYEFKVPNNGILNNLLLFCLLLHTGFVKKFARNG